MKEEFVFPTHFPREEVACHCCGKIGPYPEALKHLLGMMEKLRERIGKPIMPNCMYRCPYNNAAVGGVLNSLHTKDQACDCYVPGMTIDELADAARDVGFGGIGRYYPADGLPGFVHMDTGPVGNWVG